MPRSLLFLTSVRLVATRMKGATTVDGYPSSSSLAVPGTPATSSMSSDSGSSKAVDTTVSVNLTDGGRVSVLEFCRRLGEHARNRDLFRRIGYAIDDAGITKLQDLKEENEEFYLGNEIRLQDALTIMAHLRAPGAVKSEAVLAQERRDQTGTAITHAGERFDTAVQRMSAQVAAKHVGRGVAWLAARPAEEVALIILAGSCRWPIEWRHPTSGDVHYVVPGTSIDYENLLRSGLVFPENATRSHAVVPLAWWYNNAELRAAVNDFVGQNWAIPFTFVVPDPSSTSRFLRSDRSVRRQFWCEHFAAMLAARHLLTCYALGLRTVQDRQRQWVTLDYLFPVRTHDDRTAAVLGQYEVNLSGGVRIIPTADEQQLASLAGASSSPTLVQLSDPNAIHLRMSAFESKGSTVSCDVVIPARRRHDRERVCVAVRCHLNAESREHVDNSLAAWRRWYDGAVVNDAAAPDDASSSTSSAGAAQQASQPPSLPVDLVLVVEEGADEDRYDNRVSKNSLQQEMVAQKRFAYVTGKEIMTTQIADLLFPGAPRPERPYVLPK